MRILITGGNGFLGRKLAQRLLAEGGHHVTLLDIQPGAEPLPGTDGIVGDLCDPAVQDRLRKEGFDSVFHLAAVVSAAAEADFDLGMRVNVDGTRALLEVCRALPAPPRVVFASSVAVFGHAPPLVLDETPARPQSSYGTQKAIGELLVNDYSRKGFIRGCSLRLPTVVVRPGKPNLAASSFASGIIREPLSGERSTCPVPQELALWITSPARVVANLLHAHTLPSEAWEDDRTLNLPGISVTISSMIAALEKAGGDSSLIDHRPDERIARIVASWPADMDTARANRLGFSRDTGIDAIVRAYVEEDMPKRVNTR
ncbi:D-erythronate dehydrogenase [Azospirillum canadense]|uniref:D-erythronate dehydrogenase n=1 Tax=Azospirillum canadense TaxID=403962 RepID=UPI002227BDF1|nr:D-erythronate dehydrogenase [Azospirillum canadense]MCW2244084.1 nucleoside-diphosphate-sugar epimerase [Azospirillum canadense]